LPQCVCLRVTAITLDAGGKIVKQVQKFRRAGTGDEEIEVPEEAEDFPEVYGFRSLEQLPFYPLLQNGMGAE
jgi:hypothetical protein